MDSEKENGVKTTQEEETVVVTTVDAKEKNDDDDDKKEPPVMVDGTKQQQRKSARIRQSQNSITTRRLLRMKQLFWPSSLSLLPQQQQQQQQQKKKKKKRRRSSSSTCEQQQQGVPHHLRITGLVLEKVYDSPNIYVIDNFLRDSELSYLDSLIQASTTTRTTKSQQHTDNNNSKKKSNNKPRMKFQKSYVDLHQEDDDDDGNGSKVLDDQRTSTFLSLPKLGTAPLAAMETRAADLLGLSVEQMEPLQLVRYKPGQFFGIHHDLGSYMEEEERVTLPPRNSLCRRRLATLFCYINTLPEDAGGATYFPKANHLRVIPKRGRAVLFCNILQDGSPDPQTIHAGEVVTSPDHVKYGLNIWACEE